MKKEALLLAIMLVVTLTVTADEYIDPQTNVVYIYEPGQTTASVKEGHEEVVASPDYGGFVYYYSGCPDAAGDVVILDRFVVETEEYLVSSIGKGAFWGNKNIKSVSIPETVTDIGEEAFYLCDSLTTVRLPEGLKQIANSLFVGCSQLISVNIPSSVYSIGSEAFYGCTSLAELTLPAGLTHIWRDAFKYTPWYATQYDTAPDGPFYIGSVLFGFKGDKPTGDLVIKEGTTFIGYYAFYNCKGLTSITVPESVVYFDQNAFSWCTGLKAVHISNLAAWCNIEFVWSDDEYGSNPLRYAHHLYLNGEEVTDLVIPEGVTSIGKYAFQNCYYLTSVTFPESLKSIDEYAFNRCEGLTSVTIPDGVTNIGWCAFQRCSNLTSVTIPPSVSQIGFRAFELCQKLNAVYISDIAKWCGISFNYSANPLYYDAHLYLNGEEVTDLDIPEGVTSIGNGAFRNCSHLTSATFSNSVTRIGESAFEGCSGLASISLPPSLRRIDNGAFAKCPSLTSVTIPEGVTSIGVGAFSGCDNLTTVTIPASVCSISVNAFRGCRSLASITSWIEEPFEIADNIFDYYDGETSKTYFTSATLYVPKGCKARYEATAGWKNFTDIREMDGTGIGDVQIGNADSTSSTVIYDLQGRRLNATPQKGIYIQNGKKKLVK